MVIPQIEPLELVIYMFTGMVVITTVVFILGYVLTLSIGLAGVSLRALPSLGKAFVNRFGSPVDRSFELNWGLRQFFGLFSERMSERWYEARCHAYRGIWVSLMCAFGICEVVRYEFTSKTDDSRMYSKTVVYWWKFIFEKKSSLHRFLFSQFSEVRPHMPIDADGPYQILRAGHNVIWDFMNGSFGSHED